MTTVTRLGALGFGFGSELAGRSVLGRFLSGFLALFWGGPIVIQAWLDDPEVKRI